MTVGRPLFVLLLGMALVASGCNNPEPEAGTATTGTTANGAGPAVFSTEQTVAVDGKPRTFRLFTPTAVKPDKPVPLVLLLHGLHGYGKAMEQISAFDAQATRLGFVVAYPDALAGQWNTGFVPPAAAAAVGLPDDVRFLSAVIDDVGQRQAIDRRRVYVAGHSDGARMTYRFGCDRADRLAAMGPVEGGLWGECHPSRAVPILHVQGELDHGEGPGALEILRRIQKCPQTPTVTKAGPATSSRYGPCASGVEMILAQVAGVGHEWSNAKSGYDMSANIADFFMAHAGP